MPAGMIFWMLMIMWAVFGWFGIAIETPYRRLALGGCGLLTFILLFLLGWKVFGFVVQ